jgi:hypothetical protein
MSAAQNFAFVWRAGVALFALGLGLAGASAKPALSGCDAFIDKLRKGTSEMQVDFSHSLVVSRARSDENAFDITTKVDVDATLTCRGDDFLRFESRVVEPTSARAATSFEHFNAAALRAALGWDAGRASEMIHGLDSDVREYLAASKQRGDVYVAGKTEEHLPGAVDLGLIFTETDRAFIILGRGK